MKNLQFVIILIAIVTISCNKLSKDVYEEKDLLEVKEVTDYEVKKLVSSFFKKNSNVRISKL